MSSKTFRVERSMEWLLGAEGILIACIVGISLHHAGMRGSFSTAIGIIAAIVIIGLIINVLWVFWTWTLLLTALIAYNVFDALHSSTHDIGWGLLGGIVAAVIVIGLHLAAREHAQSGDDVKIIRD